jgi:hypothetical protein
LVQTIAPAATAADFAEVAALIGDYVDWCRARYADEGWLVDAAFGHQSLDIELASGFPAYRPPAGPPSSPATTARPSAASPIAGAPSLSAR